MIAGVLLGLLADLVFGGVDPADCAPADWLAEVDPAEVRELADEAQEPASDAVAGARCA